MEIVTVIILLGVVLFVFFGPSEGFRNPNKHIISESKDANTPLVNNHPKEVIKRNLNPSIETFKKKDYRDYELKGVAYHSVRDSDIGIFKGWASTTFNSHDRYAVEIRHEDGRKFGFIPKGNFRMANYIDSTHNNRVPIWGYIARDDYGRDKSTLFGHVSIPVLFDSAELKTIDEVLTSYVKLLGLLENHESLNWEEAQEAFELDKHLRTAGKALKPSLRFDYANIMGLMTRWSIAHEKSKDYSGLIKLGRYQALISSMPTARQNGIQKRIEKAFEAIGSDIS